MTKEECISIIHRYESTKSNLDKRTLKVLIQLRCTPKLTFTQITKIFNTGRMDTVRPLVDLLLSNGHIVKKKKSLWVPKLHVWRVIDVYQNTAKGEQFIQESTGQIMG